MAAHEIKIERLKLIDAKIAKQTKVAAGNWTDLDEKINRDFVNKAKAELAKFFPKNVLSSKTLRRHNSFALALPLLIWPRAFLWSGAKNTLGPLRPFLFSGLFPDLFGLKRFFAPGGMKSTIVGWQFSAPGLKLVAKMADLQMLLETPASTIETSEQICDKEII